MLESDQQTNIQISVQLTEPWIRNFGGCQSCQQSADLMKIIEIFSFNFYVKVDQLVSGAQLSTMTYHLGFTKPLLAFILRIQAENYAIRS